MTPPEAALLGALVGIAAVAAAGAALLCAASRRYECVMGLGHLPDPNGVCEWCGRFTKHRRR